METDEYLIHFATQSVGHFLNESVQIFSDIGKKGGHAQIVNNAGLADSETCEA